MAFEVVAEDVERRPIAFDRGERQIAPRLAGRRRREFDRQLHARPGGFGQVA